ncbi:beta-1,3-galactosyltransferase GALT1-like [Cucurbita pepo subsp. pepo]|uniref:beta-1,3-galactosyltransferase GALT1-like n=1 Tax=Cucurbita pepo subsp. pepo TaxID=3664 RepID=UPI000C9D77A0|nr:beta-1,3-galactosyltransferase GALT1-like [Cucurbita pepo subsp. pepo]XP_023547356.1 beta-1,3-galactosyltransferase GALT1-like [Cucurbita pepo subsp. pepo]XP_023547357.1 beta-1,3-galactosyltransferase GALT1-like [Cucurbita pepo subsp. pepo]XP_023547359.1 beta-1,3-galactosyltransferase GALT1-like [Cucurbita pepo subsp. pepo]
MKKSYGRVLVASFCMLLLMVYVISRSSTRQNYYATRSFNSVDPLQWLNPAVPSVVQNPEIAYQVITADSIISSLFTQGNFTNEERQYLQTWNHLRSITNYTRGLPNAVEAIKEAGGVWNNLKTSIEKERLGSTNESARAKEKQCPHFLTKMNATKLDNNGHNLRMPCGLTQGSSITIIGIPDGLLGNFQIDLTGEPLPGEPDPSIILHYNVRLLGDKLTEDPVIVQNTWTVSQDWGEEERCPSSVSDDNGKVDELEKCNKIVGNVETRLSELNKNFNKSKSTVQGAKAKPYFPFKLGHPFAATLRVGVDGIQTTVDGKHVTSFAYRETLEPWLVSEVKISGDLKLISVLASGLPTSEDSDHIVNIEALKSIPLSPDRPLDLFIGVFSTANNFKYRMAVRRTWMQYPEVRSGSVAVRFFVGLHKNQIVNEEVWDEARTYGDIQMMPFVDYYSLITWKTLGICIFGAEIASAKYIMKTDDDAFVRVDEVLASLNRINAQSGLLYGLINSDSQPHRDPDSKWYIGTEEWPEENYPTWAHGPGYVVSSDIAKTISKKYKEGSLKMFKLEDVAMGIWIENMKREGLDIRYEKDERIHIEGCKYNYVVAHYQGPQEMLCLWQKLQEGNGVRCCGPDN